MRTVRVFTLFLLSLLLISCGSKDPWADLTPDYEGLTVRFTDEQDCGFWYPEDWYFSEPTQGVYLVSPPDGLAEVSLVREKNADGIDSAERYWEVSRELLVETYGDNMTFLEDGIPCYLGGMDAMRCSYRLDVNGYHMILTQVCCPRPDRCYVLTYTSLSEDHDTYLPVFRNMVNAFTLS